MKVHDLAPAPGSTKKAKRVGRGTGGKGGNVILWESAAPTDGYESRRTGAAAQKVVDGLYEKHGFYSKVIEMLKADKALGESVRKVALQIANARLWEDAEKPKKVEK